MESWYGTIDLFGIQNDFHFEDIILVLISVKSHVQKDIFEIETLNAPFKGKDLWAAKKEIAFHSVWQFIVIYFI